MAACIYELLVIAVLSCLLPMSQTVDRACLNKRPEQISVDVIIDTPNKIQTFVRGDTGYAKNLECKWELRASDYSKPRQMLLKVKNVDFDNQTASRDQCYRPVGDVFSFSFSGILSNGEVISDSWYSNDDARNASRRLIMANLWNSSNYLTVEFKSDNNQVRSDAKGVEMDVVIMREDYCHSSMLFHDGSCYLTTEDRLNFKEAFEVSKSLQGNLVAFPSMDSLNQFIKSNSDRASVHPFKAPLWLAEKVWTGHFSCGIIDRIKLMNRENDCNITQTLLSVQINNSVTLDECCHLAMEVISERPQFTCEPQNSSLRALIHFAQVPATVANLHPRLFRTCNLLDVTLPIAATQKTAESTIKTTAPILDVAVKQSPYRILFYISVALIVCLVVTCIALCVALVCLRRQRKAERCHHCEGKYNKLLSGTNRNNAAQ